MANIEHFAWFTGDTFYAQMDEEAVGANSLFVGWAAHEYLISAPSRSARAASRTTARSAGPPS